MSCVFFSILIFFAFAKTKNCTWLLFHPFIYPWILEIEATLSEIFSVKTSLYECSYVSLTLFIDINFKWLSLNIFPWTQRRLYFNNFLWLVMFKIFEIVMKHTRLEQIPPSVSLFETFSSNRPFICNHQQTIKHNKRGVTFCEGLKWMCKLFEISGQKDF